MLSEHVIYLAAALNTAAGAAGIYATLRCEVAPHPVSWLIWAATGWLAFGGQVDEGVGAPGLLTLSVAVVATLILIASFLEIGVRDRKLLGLFRQPYIAVNLKQTWQVSRLDLLCGALACTTFFAWQVTASGNVAIALSIAVDALAGIPTVTKAYKAPHSEPPVLYLTAIVSGVLTLLPLPHWGFSESAYAMYFVGLNTVISIPLVLSRLHSQYAHHASIDPDVAVAVAVEYIRNHPPSYAHPQVTQEVKVHDIGIGANGGLSVVLYVRIGVHQSWLTKGGGVWTFVRVPVTCTGEVDPTELKELCGGEWITPQLDRLP